jgi:CheY-like chemotaxis protein
MESNRLRTATDALHRLNELQSLSRRAIDSARITVDSSRTQIESARLRLSSWVAPGPPRDEESRPVVLLIDDDQDTRDMYIVALEACGYHPVPAADGATALYLASALMPSLVVTDVWMPGHVTAMKVCEFFRSLAIPVIVLTALARHNEDVKGIVSAGCGSILIKPVSPDALCNEVRQLLLTPPPAAP